MRGLRYSLYVLLIFVMSGCALFGIPRYEFKKKDIGIQFTGNYAPEIEGKLNIDEYYYVDRPYTLGMYAFYPDGTCLSFVFDKGYNYIGKNTNNLDGLINKDRNLSFNGGIFKIKGDTLEIHFFWRDYYLRWAYHWLYEIDKFEIVDKSTLRCIINVPGMFVFLHTIVSISINSH